MKKLMMAAGILLAVSTSSFAQDSTQKSSPQKHKTVTTKKYTCTMHPEVVMDKPGKCPKCGMKLVAKKTSKKTGDMKM